MSKCNQNYQEKQNYDASPTNENVNNHHHYVNKSNIPSDQCVNQNSTKHGRYDTHAASMMNLSDSSNHCKKPVPNTNHIPSDNLQHNHYFTIKFYNSFKK